MKIRIRFSVPTRSVVLVALLSVCFMQRLSAAEPFHGAELYEAVGPVKEIKLVTKDPLAENKKVKISEEGKLNSRMMTYNQEGYAAGYSMKVGSRGITLDIFYGSDNRVDSISHLIDMMAYYNIKYVNTYDESGKLVGRNATKFEKEGKKGLIPTEYRYSFSDVVNDDYGNWVSRKVCLLTSKDNSEPSSEEYVETRTIKYY